MHTVKISYDEEITQDDQGMSVTEEFREEERWEDDGGPPPREIDDMI